MRFVIAGPLDAAELLQSAVAHPRVHRTELAHFVPDAFRIRFTPIVPETPGQIINDRDVVANSRGRGHGTADTLHAALTRSNRAFGLAPPGGGRQNDVGHRGSAGVE